jgi:predicted HTH transcriptional regulator
MANCTLISGVMRALGFVNRFRMGIGLVADELKENGNPPAEYILSEPSSFKVIVRSADPLSEQIRTNTEVSKTDLSGSRTNERTNPNKSIEDRLIEIVRVNSTISKTALAHELGIGRTKLYELLATMAHRVRSTGGTRHVEWTVLED